MVLLAWLFAAVGLAGGSYVVYRKFIAPEQSMWEGISDWFASKDVNKAAKSKSKKVDRSRGDLLKEIKDLHEDDSKFNVILKLLEKGELSLEEFKLLSELVESENNLVQEELRNINDCKVEIEGVSHILVRESKAAAKASQEVRLDWQEEYEIFKRIEENCKLLIPIVKKEVESFVSILKMISDITKSRKSNKNIEIIIIKVQGDMIKQLKEGRELRKKLGPTLKRDLEELKNRITKEETDVLKEAA